MLSIPRLLIVCAAACACGCAATAQAPASGRWTPEAPAKAAASSSVLDFVSRTAPGQPADPALRVQVVSDYHAASGRQCKQYLVTDDKGASRSHVACRTEQGWTEVRPLIAEGLAAPAP